MHIKNDGFTLIELIVVLVIMGILLVSVVPRFINFGGDVRLAQIKSLEGVMRSASNLVNLKARIENKTDCSTDPTIEVGSKSITLRCGYPCPHPSGIANAVDADDSFIWIGESCAGQLGSVEVQISDAPDPNNCKILYSSARVDRPPSFTLTTTGC